MKRLLILLAVSAFFISCRKSSGPRNAVACWQCAIEGYYNGKLVDIDTNICNMTEAQINEFEAKYNVSSIVVVCNRALQ